ncbi:MAG: glutamyl-tRNA reductase [Flavobacteriaceae bacterium]|nr:glutamyl-tRNA reductase [Flavobacteriaceae bacterium]
MKAYNISKHHNFYTVGLNYKKADATTRGKFSLTGENIAALLAQAKVGGIDGLLVNSTCNRTELHGFAEHPFQLIKLLCDNTNGSIDEFQNVAYVHKNYNAINHLFRVGTGLDSQILGDFEIISQLKKSFARSKELGLTNHFLERLLNAIIQASKRIKNETEISSGATSVAFASVQYILARVSNISNKNILLFGTGKIGRNTCENLIKHTKNSHITLINRTREKAEKIAGRFHLIVKNYTDLAQELKKTDVLIVATGAQEPTIYKELIPADKQMHILDLSIPKNVDENVEDHPEVTLVHLDHLSVVTDKTLERRKKYIPQANEIINEVKDEFIQWLETRKFAPTIKALRDKLQDMKDAELDFQRKKMQDFNSEQAEIISNRIIQKITTQFANHLKSSPGGADASIDLIQKVFQIDNSSNE